MRITGIFLLLALLLSGASLNDARKANEAYNNGNYAEAEQLYKKAIEANPENAKLYFNLGNALVNQGKTDEALRVFEEFKTMTDDPKQEALADYNIGNIYTQNKEWDKAINSFKNALRYREADADAKHNYELAKRKKEEQQKQQQNQQNQQNNQDQNQNQQDQQQQNQQNQNNQNQNQQQNQQQQKQNQSQQNQSGDQQQQQNQQQRPSQISKAQAEKILQALEQKEKDLLKEFKKKKTESSDSNNEKDW